MAFRAHNPFSYSSIRVPKLHLLLDTHGCRYLYMELAAGRSLSEDNMLLSASVTEYH